MGKNKLRRESESNGGETSDNKKMRFDDADDQEDTFYSQEVEDEDDQEESEVLKDASILNPNSMSKFVKDLEEFYGANCQNFQKSLGWRPYKIVKDYLEKSKRSDVSLDSILKSWKYYLKMSHKRINFKDASSCINSFLDRGESVEGYSDFPQNTPRLLNYYASKNGLVISWGKAHEVNEKMKNDNAGRQQSEKEVAALEEKHIEELETFLNKRREDLNENQQRFVQQKIARLRKKFCPPTPRGKGSKKPNQKQKLETAFDFYCLSVKDKYSDLDEESRKKKLTKKFSKLDDDKRLIFEQLALNA